MAAIEYNDTNGIQQSVTKCQHQEEGQNLCGNCPINKRLGSNGDSVKHDQKLLIPIRFQNEYIYKV